MLAAGQKPQLVLFLFDRGHHVLEFGWAAPGDEMLRSGSTTETPGKCAKVPLDWDCERSHETCQARYDSRDHHSRTCTGKTQSRSDGGRRTACGRLLPDRLARPS